MTDSESSVRNPLACLSGNDRYAKVEHNTNLVAFRFPEEESMTEWEFFGGAISVEQ